jgi:hypothetical protein
VLNNRALDTHSAWGLQSTRRRAPVADAVQTTLLQLAQGLVGVDQRQTQAVGHVLLRERKRHTGFARVVLQRRGALEQQDEQRRDAFFRAAPPDRQQVAVDQRLLLRGQPGHVETHRRQAAMQLPQGVTLEDAEHGLGQRLDAMCRGIAHLLLHADEVAREQETQDLSATIAQGLVAKGPAPQQRVERGIGLALMDQGLDRAQTPFLALE